MSRRGQRQVLRARAIENETTEESSASKRRRMEDTTSEEDQCDSPLPNENTSESSEDAADGDITSELTFMRSFDHFRSLDFQQRFQRVLISEPPSLIRSPLPYFNWADSEEVWKNMLKKEEIYLRDPGFFRNHPELHPRMRSILFDWLAEVCEVYRLHKETYTLAQDFIDRYLSITKDVPKTQLQLLGISALFIAAKLEEIYPPKLTDFAYVTDLACTEKEIIRQEMIIIKTLKWDLSPMTTNSWLGVYLQVANIEHITDQELGFVFPQFSTHAYIQLSRLCELSLMDSGSLQHRYSIIAASALYHHTSKELVTEVTGLSWTDIYPCVKWMAPFAKAILEVGQCSIKFFSNVLPEDCHNIQAHTVDISLMDRALALQATFQEKERQCPSSLDLSAQLIGLLMPPSSREPSPEPDSSVSEETEEAEETEETSNSS